MAIAVTISAYKRPDLLAQLVSSLPGVDISVHVDKKSKIAAELITAACSSRNGSGVHFLNRQNCHWGAFGLVEATISGLEWFLTTKAEHFFAITGQCSPIGSVDRILAKLQGLNAGSAMIDCQPFPIAAWARDEGGVSRVDRYFLSGFTPKPRAVPFLRKRLPDGVDFYGGSSYWYMSRAVATSVVESLRKQPSLKKFFKSSFIPDETMFQTLVMNGPHRDRVITRPTHYMRWTHGSPHPSILGDDDLAAISESGCFFARKFETVESMRRCAALD